MGYGYGFGWYRFDWTYLLIILAFVISSIVQSKMQSTFRKYSRIMSSCRMNGLMVARRILESEGLYDVEVVSVPGNLTDHYDPRTRTVRLSESVYSSSSLSAVSVAAHECGHAIQHAHAYAPLAIRSSLVPVANFGAGISWPLFLIGLFMVNKPLMIAGIILYSAAVLFQVVTLPVDFDASARALKKLNNLAILEEDEVRGSRKVLGAAAMTYVAAALASLLQLLRLVVLARGRSDD